MAENFKECFGPLWLTCFNKKNYFLQATLDVEYQQISFASNFMCVFVFLT